MRARRNSPAHAAIGGHAGYFGLMTGRSRGSRRLRPGSSGRRRLGFIASRFQSEKRALRLSVLPHERIRDVALQNASILSLTHSRMADCHPHRLKNAPSDLQMMLASNIGRNNLQAIEPSGHLRKSVDLSLQLPSRPGARTSRIRNAVGALWRAQAQELRKPASQRRIASKKDAFEIVVIKTSGDVIQDRSLSESGRQRLFTKELDLALTRGRTST